MNDYLYSGEKNKYTMDDLNDATNEKQADASNGLWNAVGKAAVGDDSN